MAQVTVRENESLESALKRFKRSCARDGVMSELRKREHYEKPSVRRKKKSEALRFSIRGELILKKRLMDDFKAAMKSRDEIRKNTINMVRAAIKQVEVDTRTELTDEEMLPIIAKQVKMRRDALADFEKGGRTDLIEVYNKEIEVLSEYLPKELSDDEIKTLIAQTASEEKIESGKENMGRLMGAVMKKAKGKADGNRIRKAVMEFLG